MTRTNVNESATFYPGKWAEQIWNWQMSVKDELSIHILKVYDAGLS